LPRPCPLGAQAHGILRVVNISNVYHVTLVTCGRVWRAMVHFTAAEVVGHRPDVWLQDRTKYIHRTIVLHCTATSDSIFSTFSFPTFPTISKWNYPTTSPPLSSWPLHSPKHSRISSHPSVLKPPVCKIGTHAHSAANGVTGSE